MQEKPPRPGIFLTDVGCFNPKNTPVGFLLVDNILGFLLPAENSYLRWLIPALHPLAAQLSHNMPITSRLPADYRSITATPVLFLQVAQGFSCPVNSSDIPSRE